MSDPKAEVRESIFITPPPIFQGKPLNHYAAGHRAIMRVLMEEQPKVTTVLVAWATVYVLTLSVSELTKLLLNPSAAWEKVVEFMNTHDSSSTDEAVNLAASILERVNAVEVDVANPVETVKKTLATTPTG